MLRPGLLTTLGSGEARAPGCYKGKTMKAKLSRFKLTEAYLRLVGKPRDHWTVERVPELERRRVRFVRALYYWFYCNLTGRFPSIVGE